MVLTIHIIYIVRCLSNGGSPYLLTLGRSIQAIVEIVNVSIRMAKSPTGEQIILQNPVDLICNHLSGSKVGRSGKGLQ
jgi:hypothetical protein